MLRELHWLRVPERVTFRLCVLAYRCLHGTETPYRAESLLRTSDVDTRRRLRSADIAMLVVLSRPCLPSGCGMCVEQPVVVRASVKNAPSLTTFRRELKTVLFRSSFDDDYAIVIVLHSITVVCQRLLTVGDSVVLFFFSFLSFFLILYGAPAMSLT